MRVKKNFKTPDRTFAHKLRVTPAMEAGVSDHVWSIEEIAALLDANVKPIKRGPYKKKVS